MKYSYTSVELQTVCTIEQGHLFRKGIRNLPTGDVLLIQPSDIDPNQGLINNVFHRVQRNDVKDTALIKPGDVIVKTKGSTPVAFTIKDRERTFAVTDHFMIIRINSPLLLPEFLVWYLNSGKTRKHFIRRMVGTNATFLAKKTLSSLDIPLPSLKTQKRIVKLGELLVREEELSSELIRIRKEFAETISIKAIMGECDNEW